jgi:hypothetical protein
MLISSETEQKHYKKKCNHPATLRYAVAGEKTRKDTKKNIKKKDQPED